MSQENVEIVRAFLPGMESREHRCRPSSSTTPTRSGDLRRAGRSRGHSWVGSRSSASSSDSAKLGTPSPELISDFIDAGDQVAVRYIWRGAGQRPRGEHSRYARRNHGARRAESCRVEYFWTTPRPSKPWGCWSSRCRRRTSRSSQRGLEAGNRGMSDALLDELRSRDRVALRRRACGSREQQTVFGGHDRVRGVRQTLSLRRSSHRDVGVSKSETAHRDRRRTRNHAKPAASKWSAPGSHRGSGRQDAHPSSATSIDEEALEAVGLSE